MINLLFKVIDFGYAVAGPGGKAGMMSKLRQRVGMFIVGVAESMARMLCEEADDPDKPDNVYEFKKRE
jgi:hypothetical protein